jgi:hypothetical protein
MPQGRTATQEALLVERQLAGEVPVIEVRGFVREDPSEFLPPGLVQAGQEVFAHVTQGRGHGVLKIHQGVVDVEQDTPDRAE